MKFAVGCDHAAVELKKAMLEVLDELKVEYYDFGVGENEKCDYPDMAKAVCEKVASGEYDRGMLLCGTGIGMSMAANKCRGIRAALCSDTFSARFTRLHNNANVLCMGARTIGAGLACDIADIFVKTGFEGGRHQTRIDMVMALEDKR